MRNLLPVETSWRTMAAIKNFSYSEVGRRVCGLLQNRVILHKKKFPPVQAVHLQDFSSRLIPPRITTLPMHWTTWRQLVLLERTSNSRRKGFQLFFFFFQLISGRELQLLSNFLLSSTEFSRPSKNFHVSSLFSGGRKFFRKKVKFSNCVEAEFYHLMNIIDYQ